MSVYGNGGSGEAIDLSSEEPIINGVCYFNRTTKPTTRPDTSALVVGDRWWKTDDGTEWFWNGTYWLGVTENVLAVVAPNNISVTTNHGIVNSTPASIPGSNAANQINAFVTRCVLNSREMVTNDSSNYWSNTVSAQNGFGTNIVGFNPSLPAVTTIDSVSAGGNGRTKVTTIETLLTAVPFNVTSTTTKNGSPSNLVAHFIYLYRSVYL